MKKVLFVAHVVKHHLMSFHIPYLKWFKDNGYEVHVCARNDYENKMECVIPYCDKYYDLPFERNPAKVNNLKAYKELKKIIDENDYKIIHCHTPIGGVLTRIAAKNSRIKGIKVIYTAHGFHFYKGGPFINWLLFYPVEKLCSRYTDVLITINQEDYELAKRHFKSKVIKYVPGVGIDIENIFAAQVNREKKLEEANIPKGAFVIITVGELNKNKNQEVILKAISIINNPNIYCIICGEGPFDKYLNKLIIELNILNNVKMLGFRLDVKELMEASDLFVFPSIREGLSVALMEAMSVGLPVVCSKIRGNTDLIDDKKGGYLVESTNVDEFIKAINSMVNEVEVRKDMGEYNKKKIKNFAVDNVVKEMANIYKGAMNYERK